MLVVDEEKLIINIQKMADFAKRNGVKLRPHFKAHKVLEIARLQKQYGAAGITAAKIGEAEIALKAGITDILVACPIVGPEKIKGLFKLAEQARIIVPIDSFEVAQQLNEAALNNNRAIDVYMEVDTGLKRCGLPPGEMLKELTQKVAAMQGLKLLGLMTHAGQVYGVSDSAKVKEIGLMEGKTMVALAEELRKVGIEIEEVSVGSTPTVPYSGAIPGVTEIRPGNYVFNDAIQIGLGVASPEECSLRVLTTVISAPEARRKIVDAGSKVFALDKGAHGTSVVKGFGRILGYPHWELTRLSEELGIMEAKEDCFEPQIGALLEIIPNHACTVMNLATEVAVRREGIIREFWQIAARGQVR